MHLEGVFLGDLKWKGTLSEAQGFTVVHVGEERVKFAGWNIVNHWCLHWGLKNKLHLYPRQFKRFWSAPFPWCFVLPAACVLWVQVEAWTLLSIKKLNGEDQLPLHLPRDQSIWLSFSFFFPLLPFPERLIEQSSEKKWLSNWVSHGLPGADLWWVLFLSSLLKEEKGNKTKKGKCGLLPCLESHGGSDERRAEGQEPGQPHSCPQTGHSGSVASSMKCELTVCHCPVGTNITSGHSTSHYTIVNQYSMWVKNNYTNPKHAPCQLPLSAYAGN